MLPACCGPVLITGGAGFIGRAVGRDLVQRGHRVRALDVLSPQVHDDPEVSAAEFPGDIRVGDVRVAEDVAEALDAATAIVHLAAETGVAQSMYECDRYVSVNVGGTQTVLREAQRRGLPVILASSRAVYGQGATDCPTHGRGICGARCPECVPSPSREDDELAPVSIYGETKVAAEKLAFECAAAGLPVVVLRPQNVIGAGQALHNPYTGVLAAFAARLRSGLPPQVYGFGNQTRDFIAVEDVASTVAWLLEDVSAWTSHPILNVGSGRRVTLRQLAETACKAVGVSSQLNFVNVARPGDIAHACADVELATVAGIPAPRIDLTTSVHAFMHFAAANVAVDPAIWEGALQEFGERWGADRQIATVRSPSRTLGDQ